MGRLWIDKALSSEAAAVGLVWTHHVCVKRSPVSAWCSVAALKFFLCCVSAG